jgi:alpha-tubulin suppressor-like RCC1 family protein
MLTPLINPRSNPTKNLDRLQFWAAVFLVAVILNGGGRAAAAVPQVYAGPCAYSSFLVDGVGTLSAWGANGYGNLGIGSYASQSSPSAVPFPAGVQSWRAVVAAGEWTYAIGDDSQLYGAGNISFVYDPYLTLIPPPAGAGGWSALAASDEGWLAVSTNGPIYGFINGSVSWPPRPGATRWTQVAVRSYFSSSEPDLFALDNRGKLYGFYSGTAWFVSPTFVEIPIPAGATAWTSISVGALHVLALANDGNLYGWGHNESGQLGQGYFVYTKTPQLIALPAGKTGWKAISAGGTHSMATTTDGQLFVWGYNGYGELGLGDNHPNRYAPTAVPNLTNVTAIAAGYYHSLAVSDCQVLAWGLNTSGELGAGFTSPYYPLPLGAQFSYDICSTTPPTLPLVSITAADPNASEGTWLSAFGQTNTGQFVISRAAATASGLEVKFAVGGTASNGVDYLAIPASIIIPANSNSVSLFVVPTGSTLAADPSTVVVNLFADAAYQLGNSTNATVTLIQYASQGIITLPGLGLQMQLFVGTNLNGQVFDIQSSTNLIDWSDLGTGTNVWGIVTVTETNRTLFRQRFFRSFPISGQ